MPVRRGADGADQAVGVRRLRHRLHARAAARHLHGLERGRVRRVLRLRPPAAARRSRLRVGGAVLRDELITLAHGAGGKATRDLVEALFLAELGNDALGRARRRGRRRRGGRLALTTDSYVVHPLEFPGGDIGELAVNGTVNDLAMCGARPLWLTAGFVIEEGFPVADAAADRRVDGRGGAAPPACGGRRRHEGRRARQGGRPLRHDRRRGRRRGRRRARAAARPAGRPRARLRHARRPRHGGDGRPRRARARGRDRERHRARARARGGARSTLGRRCTGMRDPTRGGLATALNELADAAGLAIVLDEDALPVRPAVNAACEILGIDPLYVANEGKLIAVVAPEVADDALAALRGASARPRRRRRRRGAGRARGHGAARHRARRLAHRRHARRRPAAAHLLTERDDRPQFAADALRRALVEVPRFP